MSSEENREEEITGEKRQVINIELLCWRAAKVNRFFKQLDRKAGKVQSRQSKPLDHKAGKVQCRQSKQLDHKAGKVQSRQSKQLDHKAGKVQSRQSKQRTPPHVAGSRSTRPKPIGFSDGFTAH